MFSLLITFVYLSALHNAYLAIFLRLLLFFLIHHETFFLFFCFYMLFSFLFPSEDQFLILACDGLWDVLSDDEAVNLVNDEMLANDPIRASARLRDFAYANGSMDNISVIFVKFHHFSLENMTHEIHSNSARQFLLDGEMNQGSC